MNLEFSSLVNPPYNHVDQSTTRFSGAAWFDYVHHTDVLVAGVGGIGSWLAFMISRLNPASISLIDDDVVDASNMAGQLFRANDIGRLKVDAVQDIVQYFSRYHHVNTFPRRLQADDAVPKVVMCGFDNMEARRAAYFAWKQGLEYLSDVEKAKSVFIDGRLSAETLQVFCISGDAPYYMQEYESKWLFSDAEAESTVCSYKQTSYCANLIASMMTNLFVNWCTNHCNPLVDRSLPFMTEYAAEQMYLKTEV